MSIETFELESPEGDLYYVEVKITGRHLPATWGWDGGSPAESPEWDVVAITDEDDNEISQGVLLREMDISEKELNTHLTEMVDEHTV